MATLLEFENKASEKSDIKPFKLLKNERGIRVWESENGLRIEARKRSVKEYFEVSIIRGERLGDININGEKVTAKEVQKEVSELAAKYNFNYIKGQVALIRKSKVGNELRRDWEFLRRKLTNDLQD